MVRVEKTAMNGKILIVTVIGVGTALGGLILNGQRSLEAAIADNRTEIREVRADVANLRKEVHQDIAELRERMARLEGLFEGHISRGGDQ